MRWPRKSRDSRPPWAASAAKPFSKPCGSLHSRAMTLDSLPAALTILPPSALKIGVIIGSTLSITPAASTADTRVEIDHALDHTHDAAEVEVRGHVRERISPDKRGHIGPGRGIVNELGQTLLAAGHVDADSLLGHCGGGVGTAAPCL